MNVYNANELAILKKANSTLSYEEAYYVKLDLDSGEYDRIQTDVFPEKYHDILNKIKDDNMRLFATTIIVVYNQTPEELEKSIEAYSKSPIRQEWLAEQTIKQKTIHCFHFKTEEQRSFDNDDYTNYCKDYGQTYPYNVSYNKISNRISASAEGMESLKTILNDISRESDSQVLFYASGSLDDYNTIVAPFIYMLSQLGSYIKNATVFLMCEGTEKIIFREVLIETKIIVKKFVNISEGEFTTNMYTISEDGYTYDYKIFKNSDDTDRLICQEWFIYFSDTAFGCVKNRLLQISGTCYLNTVMNSIILCPTARKVALQLMKNKDKFKYTKPLNLEICERKDESYLFRLIYNVICSSVPLRQNVYEQDIMTEYARFLTGDPEGGSQLKTFKTLLGMIDPAYISLSYNTNGDLMTLKDGNGDFLLIDSILAENQEDSYLLAQSVIHNGEKYILQFSGIGIIDAIHSDGHAVAGIKCDGKYIIVDSNGGMLNVDWRRLADPGVKESVREYFKSNLDAQYITITPVYIRESTIQKYENVSSEALCGEL